MAVTEIFDHHFIKAKEKSPYLMVVLHGKGDSLKPFLTFQKEVKIPWMNYLLLNAPKRYLSGYSWYGDPPFISDGVLKIRFLLFDLMRELESQGWKTKQTYLLGYSQGCLVIADFALHSNFQFAGVIGVSGYFHFFPRWRSQLFEQQIRTPWLLTHGTKDDVLPISTTKFGARKLRSAGIKVDWVEFNKKHTFTNEDSMTIHRWITKNRN